MNVWVFFFLNEKKKHLYQTDVIPFFERIGVAVCTRLSRALSPENLLVLLRAGCSYKITRNPYSRWGTMLYSARFPLVHFYSITNSAEQYLTIYRNDVMYEIIHVHDNTRQLWVERDLRTQSTPSRLMLKHLFFFPFFPWTLSRIIGFKLQSGKSTMRLTFFSIVYLRTL